MKKVSDSIITDLTQDWGFDPVERLPFSGANIQAFIKSYLGSIAKAAWFNPADSHMYWFASEDDKTAFSVDTTRTDLVLFSTVVAFGTTMYRLLLSNNNSSTNLSIATNEESLVLSVDFDAQSKGIADSSWTSTGKGANVTVFVDPGATGTYTVLQNTAFYRAGSTVNIDVRDAIAGGTNRVKIQFTMEDDASVTATITYTIEMVEMYIELTGDDWAVPIIEGGNSDAYKLGGFKIVGSLNKTLHMKIYSNENMLKEFTQVIGTSSYAGAVSYYYTRDLHPEFTLDDLPSGVYLVDAYLTAGNTVSTHIHYNIMYVAADDVSEVQLCCINNISDRFYNYTTSPLFDYSIYNKGQLTGDPTVVIRALNGSTPTIIPIAPLANVSTGEKHTLQVSLEWLVEETLDLSLQGLMTYGVEQIATVPIDNSATFPPVPGYTLYVNAASRSNADANKTSLVNVGGSSNIPVTWTRMAWMDGIDGWTRDDEGRACLLIPAGSKMRLASEDFRVLSRSNITIELCYKVYNVSDYEEPVITVSDNPSSPAFHGLRIKPTNITLHSSEDISSINDLSRGVNVKDEETIHLIITIFSNFDGHTSRNLVTGYVNGCKNFQFKYGDGAVWGSSADLVIGNNTSDIALYFMRVYPSILSDTSVKDNYINSIRDLYVRKDISNFLTSVMDSTDTFISYESVKEHNFNFFVVEMLNGGTLPSEPNNWSKEQKGRSDFEMHFGMHPEWDWKISNVETMGQGTTSMSYYRWNLRWRIDKTGDAAVPVSYGTRNVVQGKYSYEWTTGVMAGTVVFDGTGNHPPVRRITAKTNFASSMHSHKIGATKAYTELHDALGLDNDAQDYAVRSGLPKPTVAVYEYPAFGFQRKRTASGETYEFIGLFTIGPDKNDIGTFGYDLDTIPDDIIALEGTDHGRRLVMFNYPWNSKVKFLASNECLNVEIDNETLDKGWEVAFCRGLKTSDVTKQSQVETILVNEFKDAYDLVYNNSTLIIPIALGRFANDAAGTLSYINNHLGDFQGLLDSDGRMSYANYEFWIEGEYVLYHYDPAANPRAYVAGVNLTTDLGTPVGTSTIEEENEWFKQKRRERFMASAENYWDIQDALFHFNFLIFFGSMDNFGKNTYPYKMTQGGLWRWRQDDLDSMLGIGNAGRDNMPFWMEFQDSDNGSQYFGGSASVFWNLIYECYRNDYVSTVTHNTTSGLTSMGKDMVDEMVTLGNGSNVLDGILKYIKTRFWDNAQNYFPKTAYNADAKYKYEEAWLDLQNDTPLTQSLGDHYLAEYLWSYRRALYMMSYFRAGAFGNYSDATLGQIRFRPLNLPSMTLTPQSYLYPALGVGQGVQGTVRRTPGQSYTFYGPFSTEGQTFVYVQASDFLTDVGDFKDVILAAGYNETVSIEGKKLLSFKIGDADANAVTTNIQSIAFPNNYCMLTINARNASSLTGVLDVSQCSRLRSAYFKGTSLTQITLANGQKIETLELPDTASSIILKNLMFLTSLTMPSDLAVIQILQIIGCPNQNAFTMLKNTYSAAGSALQYISIQQEGIQEENCDFISILGNIAANKDNAGNTMEYGGVTSAGIASPTSSPSIEGTLQMNSGWYSSDFAKLTLGTPEDYGISLKKVLVSNFGALYLIYNPQLEYVDFADSAVKSIAATQWGDGTGLLYSEASEITSIGRTFRNNTTITSFDELRYFGITTLTNGTSTNPGAFHGCTNLKSFKLPDTCTTIGGYSVKGCSNLESVDFGNSVSVISDHAFWTCNKLLLVDLPSSVTSIGNGSFVTSGSTNYKRVVIIRATSVPTVNSNSFHKYNNGVASLNTALKIYVPNGYGNTYKTTGNWTTYASYIFELDEDGNIPT